MFLRFGAVTVLFVAVIAQNATEPERTEPTTTATTTVSAPAAEPPALQPNLNQFYLGQTPSELLPVAYLQPQLQLNGGFQRLQPQLVLYGGGQGQPILINPGNLPGNFLIPQTPGVIVRNGPQGTLFPTAGYPKPAHIPPIEKDAEEIPTNPAKIPPLPDAKPKAKPEKLETFNEPTLPDGSAAGNGAQFPSIQPDTTSLSPGQRFFILNGDSIFSYSLETPPGFRYTHVQPFPQSIPKFAQALQEPSQGLQRSVDNEIPLTVPDLILHNALVNIPEGQQTNSTEGNKTLRTAQSYARTSFPVNPPNFLQDYVTPAIIQPQLVGQFRFTSDQAPGFFQLQDDLENDAVIVDASDFDGRVGDSKTEATDQNNSNQIQTVEKQAEPATAQAGPQATSIAGPGGVAGSAPRATAIVGKGGLAVSSPQATAVAGTKEEEKKKPVKIS